MNKFALFCCCLLGSAFASLAANDSSGTKTIDRLKLGGDMDAQHHKIFNLDLPGSGISPGSGGTSLVAATIYVDATNGSPSGSRGSTAPFATLQQALAVALAGDTIEVRKGTYIADTNIYINLARITLRGVGLPKITTTGNNAGIILQLGSGASDFVMEGFEIDGKRTTGTGFGNGAIEIYGATRPTFRRLYVHDHQLVAFRFLGGYGTITSPTIEFCRIEACYQGIQVVGDGTLPVSRSAFRYNTIINGWTTGGGGGIRFTRSGGSAVLGVGTQIIGNTIDNAGTMGIELWGASTTGWIGSVIEGNYVGHCGTGISMDGDQRFSVANNTVLACAYANIEVATSCDGYSVAGNTLWGYDDGGTILGFGITDTGTSSPHGILANNNIFGTTRSVFIQEATGVIVDGNTFAGFSGLGIYLQNAHKIMVSRNIFDSALGLDAINVDASASTGFQSEGISFDNNLIYGTYSRSIVFLYAPGAYSIPLAKVRFNMATAATAPSGVLISGTATTVAYLNSGAGLPGSSTTAIQRGDGNGGLTDFVGAGGGNVATDPIFDAKGDLAVGTGADTAAKLTVGSNGKVLIADSTQTTGLRWGSLTIGSIADPTDNTKVVTFDLSPFTTGITRTVAPAPSANSVTVVPFTVAVGYRPTGIGADGLGTSALALPTSDGAAPTIASASTISPAKFITLISGTAAIATINPPTPIASTGGQFVLIPTGIWTVTTGGNSALASTAVVSRPMVFTYDVTTNKVYPSY